MDGLGESPELDGVDQAVDAAHPLAVGRGVEHPAAYNVPPTDRTAPGAPLSCTGRASKGGQPRADGGHRAGHLVPALDHAEGGAALAPAVAPHDHLRGQDVHQGVEVTADGRVEEPLGDDALGGAVEVVARPPGLDALLGAVGELADGAGRPSGTA
ncbi:hypothetical protein ABZ797_28415 [Streptomyces antimycoticus]|uniref:hypothetical protein n=1 Tax=Streptomyces antimycoticus TaxID=68175 RepID=UPI0033D4B6AA